MPFVGLVVSAIICSLPYLLYSAQFPPPAITAIALTLASMGLAILRPSDKWRSGVAVGAGILVPMATLIAIDVQRDPTSHNLLPFEIGLGLAVAMPGALLGSWVGGFIADRAVPPLAGALITAAGLLTATLHIPFVFAERAASELDAQGKLGALVTGQNGFYASNHAYTCDLDDLGQAFDTPVRRHKPVRPVEGIYKTGTWARAGDYDFVLLCDQAKGSDRFLLTATPLPGTLGRWAYCAETGDTVRQTERRRNNQKACGLASQI